MIPLKEICDRFAGRDLFVMSGAAVSYKEFAGMVEETLPSTDLGWSPESMAGFIASLNTQPVTALCELPDSADLSPFLNYQPLLILRTGGTTGAARHVVHSVKRLLERYEIVDRPSRRSLVLYEADHIAGLDAFFQALHRGTTLVIPEGREAHEIVETINEHKVQVLPATPTFLQFLLLSGAFEDQPIKSVETIPYGAEAMPSTLRGRISAAFPNARVVQRFGLTELGALPVKEDPKDPSALILDQIEYDWKVVEGELLIKAPTRMLGTLEEGLLDSGDSWYHTGDLAEKNENGSIRVLGRRDAMINVGGLKILPEAVENFLLEQEEVLDVAVYSEWNALTGQAVVADVIFRRSPVAALWLRSLRKIALARGLSLAHVPTHIHPVDRIRKSRWGKRLRRPGKA